MPGVHALRPRVSATSVCGGEMLGLRLLALHNVTFLLAVMARRERRCTAGISRGGARSGFGGIGRGKPRKDGDGGWVTRGLAAGNARWITAGCWMGCCECGIVLR